MNKFLEGINKSKGKWLELSITKKIVIGVLVIAFLSAAVYLGISSTQTKYGVLYSQMNTTDSTTVLAKLKADKVAYKVDSSTNTIYVPESQVDNLRLEYAPLVKNGSSGFELFDNTSQFGMTDQQFNVTYLRALEGELERTIKSISGVDNVRVQLAMADDSVFVKDQNPGTASVYLKMKSGQTLSKAQVKAIISLISGGVKNLPAANVQVVDDNMTLLSKDVGNSNGSNSDISDTSNEKSEVQTKAEDTLQKKVLAQLEPIYGSGKVKVQVNADMNFDANSQKSTVLKDPVIISQHTNNTVERSGTSNSSGSPTDNNNNSNQIVGNSTNGASTTNDVTTNYDTSKVETKTETSPGNITRLTVSVVVNGTVSTTAQASINNIVSQAVGLNAQRGDTISIEGMKFDTTLQDNEKKALQLMNQEAQAQQRTQLIEGITAGVLLLIALIVFIVLARRKKKQAEEDIEEGTLNEIDTLIGDEIKPKEKIRFEPIEFEQEDINQHIEKEIKQYASSKPEQVADVVKAWLTEDER